MDDLRFSRNTYDWLGHGVYFWENDQHRAFRFAQELSTRKRGVGGIKEPAVVGAILDIGFCLDLANVKSVEFIEKTYSNLLRSSRVLEISLPENISPSGSVDLLLRYLDCTVIEMLHLERIATNKKPFDSVRSSFIEGKPVSPNAGFYTKSHTQLCIRNPNCIKGYFLPRTANDRWSVP